MKDQTNRKRIQHPLFVIVRVWLKTASTSLSFNWCRRRAAGELLKEGVPTNPPSASAEIVWTGGCAPSADCYKGEASAAEGCSLSHVLRRNVSLRQGPHRFVALQERRTMDSQRGKFLHTAQSNQPCFICSRIESNLKQNTFNLFKFFHFKERIIYTVTIKNVPEPFWYLFNC